MKSTATTLHQTLLTATLVIGFLYFFKDLLVPLVLAIFLWFGAKIIDDQIKKMPLFSKLPRWLRNTFTSLIIFVIIFLVFDFLASTLQEFYRNIDIYEENIRMQIKALFNQFGSKTTQGINLLIEKIKLADIISSVLATLTNILGISFIVVFYVIFLINEQSFFLKKLTLSFRNRPQFDKVKTMIHEINKSIRSYLILKTMTSAFTAAVSLVIMEIFGLDFSLLWAFLIFLFNFIPNIGSIIATMFPALFALAQFSDITYAIGILSAISALQIIVGNFLEPKIMGSSLNLSPLWVIVSLVFWGLIWGGIGMLLSVPIMAFLMIVFSNIPSTRIIAIWLSGNGDIKPLRKELHQDN